VSYSSICDVNATFSCSQAYTSRFGSVAGIPVALIGVLYFTFVLGLLALCQRSHVARQNMVGYVFAVGTAGLATVLYLAYASVVVLETICLLCAGTYVAVVALFLVSGAADRQALSGLPTRASRDLGTLLRTPAALASAMAFILASASAVAFFPGTAMSAPTSDVAGGAEQSSPAPVQLPRATLNDLEAYLSTQPRVTIPGTGGSGAAVVVVKFNDYQCPPCGATFKQYKPVLARLQQQHPGKIAFITKDFPLETECNAVNLPHPSACEAAVAVRLAREKGRADAMEEWLFANQSTMTPERVRAGAASVAGVTDFDARYAKTLELVRAEAAEGVRLAVKGTPTFFLNGIRLPIWPPEIFQAAIEWELRRVTSH
jgi:uncharacterized membrane protein/protein-disulfide isomerase